MHDLWVEQRRTPELTVPWLGELFRVADGEFRGSVEVETTVRQPRLNGERDVEVYVEVAPGSPESSLRSYMMTCSHRLRAALETLSTIKHYAAAHAPSDWAAHYGAGFEEDHSELLFLDCMEVEAGGRVAMIFDFSDLDQLVVRLDEEGHGTSVSLRR